MSTICRKFFEAVISFTVLAAAPMLYVGMLAVKKQHS